MDDLLTEIVTKFESIISNLVKKVMATTLKPLEEKVAVQSGTISDLEHTANEHDDQLTSMQANMAKLSAAVESLSKRCENLEACSGWNNIRFVVCLRDPRIPDPRSLWLNFYRTCWDLRISRAG